MELLEAIFNRRSIRQYTDRHVSDDVIETLLKAAMYAPSAVNKQPWHYIVFRDREIIEKIILFHQNASMLRKADAAILVCWDEELQHDIGYGPVDCSAATQNILLAAYSLGLGSVWVGLYPRIQRMESIHALFGLPQNIRPFSIVSLGYPAEEKKMPIRFNSDRIHFEKWQ
jgi:nitroreductase